jgi:hypothetical protein
MMLRRPLVPNAVRCCRCWLRLESSTNHHERGAYTQSRFASSCFENKNRSIPNHRRPLTKTSLRLTFGAAGWCVGVASG